MGEGHRPCSRSCTALRHRGFRGHSRLRDLRRHCRVPSQGAHGASAQLGTGVRPRVGVDGRPAHGSRTVGGQRERTRIRLHPSARLSRDGVARSEPDRHPDPHRDCRVALGRVPRGGGTAAGHPGAGVVVAAARPPGVRSERERDWRLRQQRARETRGDSRRVRRSHPAQHSRFRGGGLRREPLPGAPRGGEDATGLRGDPRRDHARDGDAAPARRRLRRRRDGGHQK
ncbi:hypothetical protein BMS3Bbin01_02157 [bacterium BMS3Bbin01]|nr:hypothetical protein BMS3Bbin01_02157 [bacterium BMS3Bbin01]